MTVVSSPLVSLFVPAVAQHVTAMPAMVPAASQDNAGDNAQRTPSFDPLAVYHGVLPNGEGLQWGVLDQGDIAAMRALQDAVAVAASDAEKRFLITRTALDYALSMRLGHVYWGAWANGQLVAVFGMAENDEEIGDGRGEATPLAVLGVTRHNQVDILKAAQVHPAYREQGLASLAALARYARFLNTPHKRVLMTKVHGANHKVTANYTKNGFTPVFTCPVTDRGETFELVTLMATRAVISRWLNMKLHDVMRRFGFENTNQSMGH